MKKFLSGLFILASFHSFGQRLVLNVPQFSQMRTNWCWAACAQMIDQYHTNGTSTYGQCQIVESFLREKNTFLSASASTSVTCCSTLTCACNTSGTSPNVTIPYNHPVGVFRGVTLHTVLVGLGYYNTMDKKIDLTGIKREIDKCTPMVLGCVYKSGGNHIVVVKGYDYSPAAKMLIINDPLKCDTCTIEMINYESVINEKCISSLDYFIGGIYRKDFSPCEKCDSYINNPFEDESVTFKKPESGYAVPIKRITALQVEPFEKILQRLSDQTKIKIPVSYIDFPSLNKVGATFDNVIHSKQDTDYYYYQNNRFNVLTKQNIDGKLMITQVKSCGYPLQYKIFSKSGKDSFQIDLLSGDYKFEIIRAPGPFFIDFYKFTNREGRTFIVPSRDYIGLYINKKKPLLALHEFNKRCILKELKELFAPLYNEQLLEGLFSESLLTTSKSYKQWQKSLK